MVPRRGAAAPRFEAGVRRRGELFAILGVFADQMPSTRRPTTSSPSSCATRSARSSTTPRRPRRCARRTTPSAPSGRASTPATTRRTTCPHVRLVDLRKTPIATDHRDRHRHRRRSRSSSTSSCYATGFDAMTGAIVGVDITGRDGVTLKDKWADGPTTYLGPDDRRLPEPVHDHRPGQPVGAVEHGGVDRAARRLDRRLPRPTCATTGVERIEPTETAEAGWVQHVNDCADITLLPDGQLVVHGRQRARQAARVPALRRRRRRLPQASATRSSSGTTSASSLERCRPARSVNDGVIRRLQPDVAAVLDDDGRPRPAADRVDVARGGPRLHGGRRTRRARPGPRSARSSTASCPAPRRRPRLPPVPARRRRARTRSSSTSTAAAGCSAATTPTTRSAATCASAPTRSSCRSTTATRPEARFPAAADDAFAAAAVDRRPRRRARRHPRAARRRRVERRRQRRRRRLPAGPRRRRARASSASCCSRR